MYAKALGVVILGIQLILQAITIDRGSKDLHIFYHSIIKWPLLSHMEQDS